MKGRFLLLVYLGALVLGTMIHQPWQLLILAAAALAFAGRRGPGLVARVLKSIWPFVLAVSGGYLLLAWGDLRTAVRTLVLINVRVFTLTLLTFALLARLDLQKAVGFSPTLRFVLILVTSQVLTFRRLFADFRLALDSRTPRRAGLLTALRHGAATSAWFLRRAEHDAGEITQALEARGFFLDRS